MCGSFINAIAGGSVAFPLALFLPGFLALDLVLPAARRNGLERFCLAILGSVLITSFLLLALADVGVYSLRRLLILLGAFCVAALAWRKRRGLPALPRLTLPTAALPLGLLLLLAVPLFFRPHEDIGGGWDPGVQLQMGASIAEHGGVNYRDPFFASLSPDTQALFVHTRNGWPQRFPGFRIVDGTAGRISPQFYALYPCWVALFYGVGGLPCALYVNPLFALFALMAVYLVADALWGLRAAVMAGLLLAANVVQIWFARFSTAEIVAQFLVWSGIFAFARHAEETEDRRYGALAAACFSAALLAHVSLVILLLPIGLVLGYRALVGHGRRDWPMLAWLLAGVAVDFAHNRWVSLAYFDLWRFTAYMALRHRLALLCLTAVAAAFLSTANGRRRAARVLAGRPVRAAAAATILALAAYAYVLRPYVVTAQDAAGFALKDAVNRVLGNARSFREMGWFFTTWGLVLATGSAAWMAWRGMKSGAVLFWGIALTCAVIFFRDKMIEPFYMFTLRRFVPVVIPAIVLFIAAALARLRASGRAGSALAWLSLAISLVIPFAYGLPVVRQVDYRGMTGACRELAARMGEDDPLVVCDGARLAAPLYFFADRTTLAISDPSADKYRGAEDAMARWLTEGRRVLYLTGGGLPWSSKLAFTPAGEMQFSTSRLAQTVRSFPRRSERRDIDVRIFRAEPAALGAAPPRVVTVRLADAFIGIGDGFLAPRRIENRTDGEPAAEDAAGGERAPSREVRPFERHAALTVPWWGSDKAVDLALQAGGASAGQEPAVVRVAVNGCVVGQVPVAGGMREYDVRIPPGAVTNASGNRATLSLDVTSPAAAPRILLESVTVKRE